MGAFVAVSVHHSGSSQAESIRKVISNLEFEGTLKTNGPINYKKLSFIAEDIVENITPIELQGILSSGPKVVGEGDLLRLLIEYSNFDEGVLPILEAY